MLSLSEEKALYSKGYRYVAGIDEVGRGPLAGPVVAAAVILPTRIRRNYWTERVKDSKLLSASQREYLSGYITDTAISYGIGIISSQTVDFKGIAVSTRLAMKQALDQLSPHAEFLLIDYVKLPEVKLPQKGVVEGDSVCFSIACASIIAKVARDKMMIEFDNIYPGYGLASNKGYGTKEHLECLKKFGPCPIHRRSFQPVQESVLSDD